MLQLTVVVPMFNEEDVLPLFVERLRPVLDQLHTSYEVIAVDDGSADKTSVVLQRFRRSWPQLRVIRLRANAGHQAALSAGLAASRGAWVVSLDADLQDPPEVIADMLAVAITQQVDVVYGVRADRSSDTAFKRTTAGWYYRLMGRMVSHAGPVNAGDFRMMSRACVDAVNALPDRYRVLRLVVPDLDFPSATVEYQRHEREAGVSKYPFLKMLKLSVDSVVGYSLIPLRVATALGLLGGLSALALLVYALVAHTVGRVVPGWTSTVVAVATFSSVQLLCVGILGEYIGRLYGQLQGRPSYFIAYDSLTDGMDRKALSEPRSSARES